MELQTAAQCLEALGSQHRLGIYRLLVQSGPAGLCVGDIKERLKMAPSTLSHHIAKLTNHGLISQQRDSRKLICCCNFGRMNELLSFLNENCCGIQGDCCDE